MLTANQILPLYSEDGVNSRSTTSHRKYVSVAPPQSVLSQTFVAASVDALDDSHPLALGGIDWQWSYIGIILCGCYHCDSNLFP